MALFNTATTRWIKVFADFAWTTIGSTNLDETFISGIEDQQLA